MDAGEDGLPAIDPGLPELEGGPLDPLIEAPEGVPAPDGSATGTEPVPPPEAAITGPDSLTPPEGGPAEGADQDSLPLPSGGGGEEPAGAEEATGQ
jgi:hypothetical protein